MNPFLKFLSELRYGQACDDYNEKLAELIQRVETHQKAGSLTITWDVAPSGKSGTRVMVTEKVTQKLPDIEREESVFYIAEGGALTRRDPRQIGLPTIEEERDRIRAAKAANE